MCRDQRDTLEIAGEFKPLVEDPTTSVCSSTTPSCARDLDLKIEGEFTGGCADSGFHRGVGTPTICAGRARSAARRTRRRNISVVDSLGPRARKRWRWRWRD
jgi:glutamate carboxypeptidase